MKRLIESIDKISESGEFTTVASAKSFLDDMARAFGGKKDQTLNITVTLVGKNMLEYKITKVGESNKDSGAMDSDSDNMRNLISQGR